jgi:transcription elongation factor GreA
MTLERSAADLLRAVGLLPDGPVVWGRPLPPTGGGVFVVEFAEPRSTAPIALATIGKWVERVSELRLDGERPTSKAVAARLAAFWLPSQPVLYIGTSEHSVSRRVAAIGATALGDRRPYSGGHWLHALTLPAGTRVWWAATAAVEEYEDALLAEFAAGIADAERAALPDRDVVLPFANLRRATGERKATGLTGSLLPEPVEPAKPPTRVVVLPDGDAEGADGSPPPKRGRAPAKPAAARRATTAGTGAAAATPTTEVAPPVDGALTVEGAERLRAELETLIKVKRPEVIARIRSAKELGDLKENADYSAAREEQSFLEGRIQALEARLRTAVIVDAPAAGARIGLGSAVSVRIDDDEVVLTIVGSSESNPATGRISSASPVGRALLGREAGDEVVVTTPAGDQVYKVVSVA